MTEIQKLLLAIDLLATYEENWNGYDAARANSKSIINAKKFVETLNSEGYELPKHVSLDNSFVVMYWERQSFGVMEVIIEEDTMCAYKRSTIYKDNISLEDSSVRQHILPLLKV